MFVKVTLSTLLMSIITRIHSAKVSEIYNSQVDLNLMSNWSNYISRHLYFILDLHVFKKFIIQITRSIIMKKCRINQSRFHFLGWSCEMLKDKRIDSLWWDWYIAFSTLQNVHVYTDISWCPILGATTCRRRKKIQLIINCSLDKFMTRTRELFSASRTEKWLLTRTPKTSCMTRHWIVNCRFVKSCARINQQIVDKSTISFFPTGLCILEL